MTTSSETVGRTERGLSEVQTVSSNLRIITQSLQSIWATSLAMISVIHTQDFRSVHSILIIEFDQFTANFPRKSPIVGMCEFPNDDFAHPFGIL